MAIVVGILDVRPRHAEVSTFLPTSPGSRAVWVPGDLLGRSYSSGGSRMTTGMVQFLGKNGGEAVSAAAIASAARARRPTPLANPNTFHRHQTSLLDVHMARGARPRAETRAMPSTLCPKNARPHGRATAARGGAAGSPRRERRTRPDFGDNMAGESSTPDLRHDHDPDRRLEPKPPAFALSNQGRARSSMPTIFSGRYVFACGGTPKASTPG